MADVQDLPQHTAEERSVGFISPVYEDWSSIRHGAYVDLLYTVFKPEQALRSTA